LAVLLLNAIYFKGEWLQKFEQSATRPKLFTLLSGKSIQVQTMVCFVNFFISFRRSIRLKDKEIQKD
jgi:serine protease inhibitor